jgi:hypothetical protein
MKVHDMTREEARLMICVESKEARAIVNQRQESGHGHRADNNGFYLLSSDARLLFFNESRSLFLFILCPDSCGLCLCRCLSKAGLFFF